MNASVIFFKTTTTMKKGIGELEEGEVCPHADGSFLEKGYNFSPLYTNGFILLV